MSIHPCLGCSSGNDSPGETVLGLYLCANCAAKARRQMQLIDQELSRLQLLAHQALKARILRGGTHEP